MPSSSESDAEECGGAGHGRAEAYRDGAANRVADVIGPRPLLAWENDPCTPRQRRRLEARPGITGLAQVMGRNRLDWDERIERDVRHVGRASPRMDAWIALRTLPTMPLGRDACHAYEAWHRAAGPRGAGGTAVLGGPSAPLP